MFNREEYIMNKLQINKKIKALVILTVFLLSVMLQSPLAYAADLILTLYNSTTGIPLK